MQFSDIKGFGEKRIAQLKEAGFTGPGDLLSYFPTRYIDTTRLTDLSNAKDGDSVVICACTHEKPKMAFPRRGLCIVKAKFVYDGKTVWASWFNQRFMVKNIVPERYYYIYGKLKKFKSVFEITAPQLIKFEGGNEGIIPVYKPIGKISSRLISDAIKASLKSVSVKGFVPYEIAKKHGLMNLDEAFRGVHLPQNQYELAIARRSLETEKLAYMICAYNIIKEKGDNERAFIYNKGIVELNNAVSNLPYNLTLSQQSALNEILQKLNGKNKLNALLEGDVGCGKTIVAFLAMYYAVLNGKQAVLLAPTEILAYQHYQKALEFFKDKGVDCAYLSSAITRTNRDKVLYEISSGKARCIFGTHSLLNSEVEFKELSLVVIDEQHRFGVAQRARLENKAKGADCIVMSATPIPRTLALTLYGDLTRIVIDEMPSRKAKTVTRFVPPEKEEAMWQYLASQAETDGRSFVVAPRISDEEDGISAESIFEKRKMLFGDKIALLHGKIKDIEKNKIMQDFACGKIKTLIATTVVEVGIDVPEAVSMVIYGADRFGLSQLHQLRGRVGRGNKDSFCFVLTDTDNVETRERLEYFVKNSDGFALAEYDFRLRGAGDFLGYSQHGGHGISYEPEQIATCKEISVEMLALNECRQKIEKSLVSSACDYFSEITLN